MKICIFTNNDLYATRSPFAGTTPQLDTCTNTIEYVHKMAQQSSQGVLYASV